MNKFFFTLTFAFVIFGNAQSTNCSCCTENHEAFDFWVGEWKVYTTKDTIAGYNSIVKIQDNCVINENWRSAKSGFTGTSNSFYNSKAKQWEQIWTDNKGGVLHLKGNRDGNRMILYSDEELSNEGQLVRHRVTWTKNDDGTVRQYWEVITKGKDIKVAFDGVYKKTE
ncbi:hypothetical protein N1F78_11495 [Seonamhaeicola sp. MEBiC1930]|uniref:hypothetical protein n=1 Tax=Seonamhaeicola sp. MEBiC01930 TaxID=2976768 RepID=UPI00324FC76D